MPQGGQGRDGYEGRFCIESFDPIAVRWFKKNRPFMVRGQLAGSLKKQGTKINILSEFLLKNLWVNTINAPDFVAYRFEDRKGFSPGTKAQSSCGPSGKTKICLWLKPWEPPESLNSLIREKYTTAEACRRHRGRRRRARATYHAALSHLSAPGTYSLSMAGRT